MDFTLLHSTAALDSVLDAATTTYSIFFGLLGLIIFGASLTKGNTVIPNIGLETCLKSKKCCARDEWRLSDEINNPKQAKEQVYSVKSPLFFK